MKKLLAAVFAAGIALTAVGPAEAAGGCGRGFHPGPRGICRPNGPPVYAHRGPPRAGYYYRGRGYWNNGRYWQNRYRYRNGWRYR